MLERFKHKIITTFIIQVKVGCTHVTHHLFCFVLCFETVASWQHCIDHSTSSARLSKLGATPGAQVSGGHIRPSTNKEKRYLLKHSHFSTSSPISQLTALSAHVALVGTRDAQFLPNPHTESIRKCCFMPRNSTQWVIEVKISTLSWAFWRMTMQTA